MPRRSTTSITHAVATEVSLSERLRRWTLILFQLLVLITPFFFTWVNEELFEFNKMMLVYGFTALILALWGARMVLARKVLFRPTLMDIPIGLFLASQILSTLFSIHPYTSIFGFYTRVNGGLLSIFCYIGLLYAAINSFTKKDLSALIKTTLVGALGVALYAIPEHFGHSPSCFLITNGRAFDAACWIQDVQSRIFGTFGQPNWLAAYAIGLLPLAVALKLQEYMDGLAGKVSDKKYTWFLWAVLVGLLMTLLFTKSRSGVVGLVGGVLVFALGLGILYWRGKQISFDVLKKVGVVVIGAVVIVGIFGTPFTPSISEVISNSSVGSEASSVAGPALETGGTESGDIRKIVWTGAIEIWKRYPVFGSGVETFAYSYYQDRPASHNLVSEWDFLYNKAHNEWLQYLSTTGLVGLGSYLLMFMVFKIWILLEIWNPKSKISTRDKVLLIGLAAGITAINISNFFGFSTVMVNVLFFLFFGWGMIIKLTDLKVPETWGISQTWQKIALGLIALVGVWSLWTVTNWWLADYDYAYGKKRMGAGDTAGGLDRLLSAITRQPQEALYYDELSLTYAQIAAAYQRDGEATSAARFKDAAELASDQTMALNDRHLNFYKNRSRVFVLLSEIDPLFMNRAQETLVQAVALAPTDAKLLYNLAVLDSAVGNTDAALQHLQQTIALKPDYQDAYLELARLYEGQDKLPEALDQYRTIQRTVAPNDPALAATIRRLEASIAAQRRQ